MFYCLPKDSVGYLQIDLRIFHLQLVSIVHYQPFSLLLWALKILTPGPQKATVFSYRNFEEITRVK